MPFAVDIYLFIFDVRGLVILVTAQNVYSASHNAVECQISLIKFLSSDL